MNENNQAVTTDSGLNEFLAYHNRHFNSVDFATPDARAFAAEVVAFERARCKADLGTCMVGVGDGSGNLFVHGTHEAVKRVQAIVLERERLTEQLFEQEKVVEELRAGGVVPQPYDDVLLPFLALMRAELHANAHKGDRPGWLTMDSKTAILEVFYHMGKLHQAVHRGEAACIKEYAADVANMCMMLVDVCGLLTDEET